MKNQICNPHFNIYSKTLPGSNPWRAAHEPGVKPRFCEATKVIGKISADGTKIYRITNINKAQPYVSLVNKTTGGNLHVRF